MSRGGGGGIVVAVVRRPSPQGVCLTPPSNRGRQASNAYRGRETPAAGAADEPVSLRERREERLAGGRERGGADQGQEEAGAHGD